MLWWKGPDWLMSRTYPEGFERFTVAARSNLIHSVQHEPEGNGPISHFSEEDTSMQGEMFLKAVECAKEAFFYHLPARNRWQLMVCLSRLITCLIPSQGELTLHSLLI